MNARIIGLFAALATLTVVTDIALWQEGYFAIFEVALLSPSATQVFTDLSITLLIIGAWMYQDAQQRGAVVWPYLLGIPLLGSFAPLTYMLVREWQLKRAATPVTA